MIDEEFKGRRNEVEEAAMKKVGTIDVMVYRQKETRIIKPKKFKLKKRITEVPQKLLKGQAISRSIEYVAFPKRPMLQVN
jgi:hypothetical protein